MGRARFQGHVERGTRHGMAPFFGIGHGMNFRMGRSGTLVITFTDNFSSTH